MGLIPSIKLLHCGGGGGGYVFAGKDLADGEPDNLNVSRKRAMVNVPHIKFELLIPTDGISTMTLRPSRNPGPDLMPPRLFRRI